MKKVMQIVDVVAFCILLIGGLNYLMAGLFGMDVMAMMFGTSISIIGRIVYSLVGLSALLLLITVIARSLMNNKKSNVA